MTIGNGTGDAYYSRDSDDFKWQTGIQVWTSGNAGRLVALNDQGLLDSGFFPPTQGDAANVSDYGAVGDGVADDWAAIQAAFDSGKGLIYFPHGSYRISNEVHFTSPDRTVIQGNGSYIILDEATGTKNAIRFGDGSGQPFGVVMENLIILRAQVATAGAGVYFNKAAGCKMINVEIAGRDFMFYGFDIYRSIDIWIVDCLIEHTVSHGVHHAGASPSELCNSRIFDCIIQHIGGSAIYCGDWIQGNGSFYRNSLYDCVRWGIEMAPSDPARAFGDFEISENNIDSNALGGIYLDAYGNTRVSDNWLSNNGLTAAGPCIQVTANSANFIFANNMMFVTAGAIGVDLACDFSVIANNYSDGGASAILLRTDARGATLNGNVILNTSGWGVDLRAQPSVVAVTGNMFFNCASGSISGGGDIVTVGNNVPAADTVSTQTGATYTITATDIDLIANFAGTVTYTFPPVATNVGRRFLIKTITANTAVSATANIGPLIGGSASTAILAATAGKWAELVSDGTVWQIMAAN